MSAEGKVIRGERSKPTGTRTCLLFRQDALVTPDGTAWGAGFDTTPPLGYGAGHQNKQDRQGTSCDLFNLPLEVHFAFDYPRKRAYSAAERISMTSQTKRIWCRWAGSGLLLLGVASCSTPSGDRRAIELLNGSDLAGWQYILADPAVKMNEVWSVQEGAS